MPQQFLIRDNLKVKYSYKANLRNSVVTAEKKNGKLILGEEGPGFEDRNNSTLKLIELTNEKYNLPDFNKIYIHTGDHEHSSGYINYHYCYGKKPKDVECFPDFNFLHWTSVGVFDYTETINEIRNNIDITKYEEMKVGWIGALNGPWHKRRILHQLGQENPDILDIINIGGWNCREGNTHLVPHNCPYLSYAELCQKYAILIDIEGGGYSGRLKYLMHSGRPVIVVDRVPKEFFYRFMKAWEHYIPVENDLSDLLEKTRWIIDNYEEAAQIGANGKEFASYYLTRDSAMKHICNLINKYHKF